MFKLCKEQPGAAPNTKVWKDQKAQFIESLSLKEGDKLIQQNSSVRVLLFSFFPQN